MSTPTLGHYELRERIGSGAMGEVWLAEDTRLHRLVALKMLPAATSGDENAVARLLREARVASSLTHPNVAVVYEVGEAEHDGHPASFIAMEYVKGRTLAAIRDQGRMEPAAIVSAARQIADALADAHERGIVHRDVKPGNVMLTERGLVKVLDFGLARYAPPADEHAATWSGDHGALGGAVVGTLAYMSPEQARGHSVDARSDVFSLGVLLYELLAGRRPFEGGNAVELIEAILVRDPPPLSADQPLAAGLGQLALRMLEKDPARRPHGMREVLRELDALLAGHAPTPAPARDHAVAVLSFANVTGSPEDAWLGAGLAETVAAGLAAVPGITVVSRERIVELLRELRLSDADDPGLAVRVGRETGARSVVSGAFQRLGERIRVTARVTETASGRVLLNPRVDGTRDGIFEVQDRILAELEEGLRGQLPRAAGPRPEDTHSLEAYEAYAKGLLSLQAESQESLDRAIALFENAIALDPSYARAHMLLGAALDVKGDYLSTPELNARALESLDRALALNPSLGEAWRYRGSTHITLGRDDLALAAFERALALNPMDASAQSGIGRVSFILRGDFAAAAVAYERALALNPRAGWSALQLAHCATLLRDFPRAESAAQRAIELQRAFLSGRAGMAIVGSHMRLGHAFALQGRHRDALAQYAHEIEFVKSVDHALRARIFIELHQRVGEAQLRLGEEAAARAALDLALEAYERRMRTAVEDPASPYYAACAHALRGETEAALACLERAAGKRLPLTAARAALEPALEPLRDEPRFRAILARAGRA